MDQPYIDVIVEGILSTILFPLASDTTFFAMQAFGGYNMTLAFWCVLAGATIGSAVNYGFGRLLSWCQTAGVSVLPQETYDVWQKRAYYFAPVIGLFCWIHLMAVLVVALGFFRVRALYVIPLLLLGQAIYYGQSIA